jgi:hypothetical protein
VRAGASAGGAGADLVDLAKARENPAAVTENARKYTELIRQARADGA